MKSKQAEMVTKIIKSLFTLLFLPGFISAQNALIKGRVTDENGQNLELVAIGIINLSKPIGTTSDRNGLFELSVPAQQNLHLRFSYTGYSAQTYKVFLNTKEDKTINIVLSSKNTEIKGATITGNLSRSTLINLNPILSKQMPSISGGIEALVKSMPGVNSNNELSSQYSVRGGNFDENLVYVNDIEIYRPFLTRSGQQEGLSFANPDLVSTVQFSSGGFDAKYGDKMSSVLDIQYKKPTRFAGSASGNLMGASLYIEAADKKEKSGLLFGFRQKSNQYILNALETKGDYKPSFTDIQLLLTHKMNEKNEFSFLGNFGLNIYRVIPRTKRTQFGTWNKPLEFLVYYEGQEIDKFTTWFGAFTWQNTPTNKFSQKFTLSGFRTIEKENYDIMGQYFLNEIDVDSEGKPTSGMNLGIGSYIEHARNKLDGIVTSLDYKGNYITDNQTLWNFGIKYQYEDIIDNLDEWRLEDSAGFAIPNPGSTPGEPSSAKPPVLNNVYKSSNHTSSHRLNGFVQGRFDFDSKQKYLLTAGVRFSYWNLNNEFIASPRLNFSLKPEWKENWLFRISLGHYAQPPFYRELRNIYGQLNTQLRAQKSVHAVFGSEYVFEMLSRPFKFTGELYYKYLYDLNPYEVDNVRIRYIGKNCSEGYATGLDLRLNGEFVKGVESWIGMSFLHTMENIEYLNSEGNISHTGYIPRPSDQIFSFNIFFQDLVTRNENLKVFANFVIATGLPNGSKKSLEEPSLFPSRAGSRLPAYKRFDIGSSYRFRGKQPKMSKKNPMYYLRDIWIGLEIFNLFNMKNTISYTWVTVYDGSQYSTPNYLTSRQLNIKLTIDF